MLVACSGVGGDVLCAQCYPPYFWDDHPLQYVVFPWGLQVSGLQKIYNITEVLNALLAAGRFPIGAYPALPTASFLPLWFQ